MIQQVKEREMVGAQEVTEHEIHGRCESCGKRESPNAPHPYEMPHEYDESAPHLYCEACYQEFRAFYEEAEDAIITALKAHHLHKRYALPHLLAALESLGGVTDQAFATYVEKGTVSFFQPRSGQKAN